MACGTVKDCCLTVLTAQIMKRKSQHPDAFRQHNVGAEADRTDDIRKLLVCCDSCKLFWPEKADISLTSSYHNDQKLSARLQS